MGYHGRLFQKLLKPLDRIYFKVHCNCLLLFTVVHGAHHARILVSEKGGKKVLRKELEKETVEAVEAFLKNSFSFEKLLRFNEVLRECCVSLNSGSESFTSS